MLRLVHEHGATSRAQLTDALGLNRSTTGALVTELADAGLVEESPPDADARSGVGRPSLVVRARPSSACVVAAYVDVHRLQVALVGLGGSVLGRRTEHLAHDVDPAVAARRVADLAAELTAELRAELRAGRGGTADGLGPPAPARVVGAGIAVPGTVRAPDGSVAAAPNLGWVDVPFGSLTSAALADQLGRQVPVSVANDADLGVVSERLRGAARGTADVIYLCGTYGLGGGIVSGGQRLAGNRGYAGEVGHISVDPAGRPCRCGSRGCWESETLAGAWADPLGLAPDGEHVSGEILAALSVGGVAARRTRDKVSRSFARGLATMVTVFNPEVVVLGDGLWRDLWPTVSGDVQPWLTRLVMPALRDGLDVRISGLGEDSTILGAAEMAFEALLEDPLSDPARARTVGAAHLQDVGG